MSQNTFRAAAIVVFGALLLNSSVAAPLPWKQSPDMLAWQVFTAMVAPAGSRGVEAVSFETWATDDDIYAAGGPHWPEPGAAKQLVRSLAAVANAGSMKPMLMAPAQCKTPPDGAAGNFPAGACIGEEVRHNWPVFNYLASNHLTSIAGLKQAYAGNLRIGFPNDSVVVKADWVKVADILRWLPAYKTPDDVRRAYYTNSAALNGQRTEFALAGMSIQSKQTPDWVWMTFEHRSNPGRCDVIGCHDDYGAVAANVAPRPSPNTDYGPCLKSPALAAMLKAGGVDPVWDNYCLKGTQTEFVTPAGKPTVLANSVIERMNKGVAVEHTSCITCHAYASFDTQGTGNFAALKSTPMGAVKPALLNGYLTHDYLWGLLAAH